MAKADLTAERLRELLHYDPDTGIFTFRVTRNRAVAGRMAGGITKSSGLICISVDNTPYQASHLAFLYVHGKWPSGKIDYLNGVKTDNRIANLIQISDRRKKPLTLERLKELVSYNKETGVFTNNKTRGSRSLIGDKAGCISKATGYEIIRIDQINYLSHRVAWFYVYGQWPSDCIDHKNGIRSDNRIENIREATRKENGQNTPPSIRNKSGYQGVWQVKGGKWISHLGGIKKRHLGTFDTPQEAHSAYLKAKAEHHKFQPTPRER